MFALIDAALSRTRTMLVLLVFILVAGALTYVTIPKESTLTHHTNDTLECFYKAIHFIEGIIRRK